MNRRRVSRAVSHPRVRHVGFFAPAGQPDPIAESPTHSDTLLSGNSLSPFMIPSARLPSSELPLNAESPIPVGGYKPSNFFPHIDRTDISDDSEGSPEGFARSPPSYGLDMSMDTQDYSVANSPPPDLGDGGENNELGKEEEARSEKALEDKTTKAERRATQDAQRAAKAAAKESKISSSSTAAVVNSTNKVKPVKSASQKKDKPLVAVSEKKDGDRQLDKDRKKDVYVPNPRMQFDDESRVERAKKRLVVKQTEARNRVELFRHLPQYEHGTRIPDLESKFFQLNSVHPAVYKVGLMYLAGDISGGNARCIAMLQAFQESIKDYSTPPEKALLRDLATKINSYVSFLIECRPLSISMGNAIRFLKSRIANLSLKLSEAEAKASLISDISRFMTEKIILADKVIVKHASTKIRDSDVLLTYGSSSTIEMTLLHAHELGIKFRVVVVDSRPKLEGQKLVRRLVGKGVRCTYTHINAISYVMHDVTRVFLGASSVLANGTVYSRVGTACVAMVANQFRVPVLVCCEAYKFHKRVQLDSICSNELGDPDMVSRVVGRKEINQLDGWANSETLRPLNLIYDATPSDYIAMIITDHGMVPPTSVPVIIREFGEEHLWI